MLPCSSLETSDMGSCLPHLAAEGLVVMTGVSSQSSSEHLLSESGSPLRTAPSQERPVAYTRLAVAPALPAALGLPSGCLLLQKAAQAPAGRISPSTVAFGLGVACP